jgi:hypothetical protein
MTLKELEERYDALEKKLDAILAQSRQTLAIIQRMQIGREIVHVGDGYEVEREADGQYTLWRGQVGGGITPEEFERLLAETRG